MFSYQASISQGGDGEIIALAVVNTIMAAAFGAMTAMILNNVILTLAGDSSKWSLLTTVNGSLIGIISKFWLECLLFSKIGLVCVPTNFEA